MGKKHKILLVDDEQDILEFMEYNLRKEGYSVDTANSGEAALEMVKKDTPDLILLDVMMPGTDGIETCREMREIPSLNDTIIAFLTARSEDYSQIAGFDSGADDYITKPIKPRVLLSRIKALLKRSTSTTTDKKGSAHVNGLIIDPQSYSITKDGKNVSLPKKEFELLSLLISRPGKVFTREEILDQVWGNEVVVGDRTIDVHIRRLREKIGKKRIKTLKGVGYKFET